MADESTDRLKWWRRRAVPTWAVILIFLVGVGIGGAASTAEDDGGDQAVGNVEEEAVTTTEASTTTNRPTTTADPTTTTTTAPPQPVEVARYQGSDSTQTQNFAVDGAWEMAWNISGGAGLIIRIIDADTGSQFDSVSPDEGQGSSFFREGGTFFLDVDSFGTDAWEIAITDVP